MNVRKALIWTLKIVLTLVIIFFLMQRVFGHWEEIKEYDWQFEWGYLVLSVLWGLFTFVIMSSNWQRIIACFGHEVSLKKSFRIFYLSDLGRYIPGKVWPLLGILYLTNKEGISPERATASFVVVQLFAIPASFLIFVLAVQVEPRMLVDQVAILGEGSAYAFMFAMILAVLVIVLWPHRFLAVANALLRKLSRPQMEFALDKRVALRILVGYSLGWLSYGVAFYFFTLSVMPEANIGVIAAAGVFNASYQIGYLALFAPGGFGPRELAMGWMLAPFVGPIGAAVALLARLWAILIEVTAALIALAIKK